MPSLVALDIAEDPGVWDELGFTTVGGTAWVAGVAFRLGAEGKRIVSWTLHGVDLPLGPGAIDGIPTVVVDEITPPEESVHPNGVAGLDHLVVATPDHQRTVKALEAVGVRLLRTRDTDTYGAPMRQGFFRLGPVILEVVGGPQPTGDGPAGFFGLAWTCADLDWTASWFGPRMHPPKVAVQEGRRIATLDRSAGTKVAMAFMSPEPGR